MGFVAFCSVGMFSAISNLGAGGTQDPQLSSTANACLVGRTDRDELTSVRYVCLGRLCRWLHQRRSDHKRRLDCMTDVKNILGPRLTLSLGTTGYSLYIGCKCRIEGIEVALTGSALGIPDSRHSLVPHSRRRHSGLHCIPPLGRPGVHHDGLSLRRPKRSCIQVCRQVLACIL